MEAGFELSLQISLGMCSSTHCCTLGFITIQLINQRQIFQAPSTFYVLDNPLILCILRVFV